MAPLELNIVSSTLANVQLRVYVVVEKPDAITQQLAVKATESRFKKGKKKKGCWV